MECKLKMMQQRKEEKGGGRILVSTWEKVNWFLNAKDEKEKRE